MTNIFNKNKTIWIISILAAVVLWMYVISEENPKTFDNLNRVPVTLVNVESLEEKGLVISDPQEYFIDIRVYGRKSQLYKIKKSALRVEADLFQLASKGTHYIPVSILGLSEDVEISSKNPDTIQITLDQIIDQERNIKINITGKPADGMASLVYTANPNKATLEGPEEILNTVRDVVATIDITNATGEVSRKLPLKAVDSNGKEIDDVKITPETVEVTVPIGPTKSVPVNTQVTGNVAEEYVITGVDTNPTNILIGATSQQLKDIHHILTEKINVEGQTKSFEKKIKLLLPQGVEVINEEAAIMVKVTIEPYIEKDFEIEKFNVINLREDLVIQEDLLESPIKITLRGSKSQIEDLKEENIVLNVDAKDLQEGQHDISLKVEVPEGIDVDKLEPSTVKIHIQGKVE